MAIPLCTLYDSPAPYMPYILLPVVATLYNFSTKPSVQRQFNLDLTFIIILITESF